MVQVSMGEHHGIQFVERERLGCGEVGHRVGIAGDVDAHIDHDAALVRGHQMARSSHFPVGAERRGPDPEGTGALGPEHVQAEVLQQLPSLSGMCLTITTDVMDRLRLDRWGALHLDQPPTFISDGIVVRSSRPDRLARVLRLHDDLAIACIERDGSDLRLVREELPNEGFRGFLG